MTAPSRDDVEKTATTQWSATYGTQPKTHDDDETAFSVRCRCQQKKTPRIRTTHVVDVIPEITLQCAQSLIFGIFHFYIDDGKKNFPLR
jgi:hypothetical protein